MNKIFEVHLKTTKKFIIQMRFGKWDGQSIMLFDISFVKENGRTCTICNLKKFEI